MARFLISAAHKSSGKTTVSIGVCAALKGRGLQVQPFKKGPDYIDPMWLSLATGNPCRNLDFYLMGREEIVDVFEQKSSGMDVALVEGNKGLYDGLDLDGSNSNAALARLLDLPVVLVIDARGMTRGIAPLILGYQAFDREIKIAGVILNHIGGSRHESKLRAVIEHYTDVTVLGAVQHDESLSIAERHLGLMPSNEAKEALNYVAHIGEAINQQVNLDALLELGGKNPAKQQPQQIKAVPSGLKIAIARDSAFGFYYGDDLDAMESAGAELIPFDTIQDAHLPKVDGIFIGGGFPEHFGKELEANATMRQDIRNAIEAGLPVYAECGGLMYLARSLTHNGQRWEMVGSIPGDINMHGKPIGRGYVRLRATGEAQWGDKAEEEIPAHEFHYSSLDNLGPDIRYAYKVLRGHGVDGAHDGIVYKNLLASYTHLRSVRSHDWADRFVAWVKKCKDKAESGQVGRSAVG